MNATATNSAPKANWWKTDFGSTERQRLFLDGHETPFFVVTAKKSHHSIAGQRHGLFGSGMSERGNAALLSCGPQIATLKHRAEQLAMNGA